MGNDERHPTTMVSADEIRWRPVAVGRVEGVDTLGLTDIELLAYVADLQQETAWLRMLLSEALTIVERQRHQIARATRVTEALRRAASATQAA